MKKIFLLLFFTTAFCNAQINFTVYDCTTLRVLYSTPTEPQAPICYLHAIVTENWVRPTYSPTCNCFFNDATQAEQDFYLAQQEAASVQEGDMISVSYVLTTWQNDSMLNALYYNQQEGFNLICPGIAIEGFPGTSVTYVKGKSGVWSYMLNFKNKNN